MGDQCRASAYQNWPDIEQPSKICFVVMSMLHDMGNETFPGRFQAGLVWLRHDDGGTVSAGLWIAPFAPQQSVRVRPSL